jgi:magnesium transporter
MRLDHRSPDDVRDLLSVFCRAGAREARAAAWRRAKEALDALHSPVTPTANAMAHMTRRATHHHPSSDRAGRIAVADVPCFAPTDTVGHARDTLQRRAFACVELALVIDDKGTYAGAVPLRRLVEHGDMEALGAIMQPQWPAVSDDTDQEHAAEHAASHGVSVLAVVDGQGRPAGVLPAEVLIGILGQEHREDLDRLVGVMRERSGARHALEDPPLRRVGRRLPWLLVGLGLSCGATAVMAGYERLLQSQVTVAFFIPALVYLTDAVGTQTEAIAVRGLSLRRKPLPFVLWSEVVTGAIIGCVLAAVAFVGIWLVFGDLAVAVGVGVSLVAAGTVASTIGLTLPWTLSRFGVDPAFGAGPVATIAQDVITILIYFVVMTQLIGF